ncbi:hypothetical protein A9179_12580 [Pseudomonas alcaligenes]|uniref:Secreted protein n=1 Tax=Aquipseudomonas alcaligenes TaxID=43263 RepID=A0ABR7S3Y9_AQUAC|nr:hypothetical protein [Pseudomonas alcaligenes]
MLLVALKFFLALASPTGAAGYRVCLTRWAANENPFIGTIQGFSNPVVDFIRGDFTKLCELRLFRGLHSLRRDIRMIEKLFTG